MVPAMNKASFLTNKLTEEQKQERIARYYKFMMVCFTHTYTCTHSHSHEPAHLHTYKGASPARKAIVSVSRQVRVTSVVRI